MHIKVGKGASVLRAKLKADGIIITAGCYSALTARIAEAEGFDAVWCGGSSMAAMYLALPDHGLITATEMAALLAPIADSVSIPVIADADLGGETSVNVMRTVHVYEQAGVAAIMLEDTVNPKHLYSRDDRLQSIDEMCSRIAAAVKARNDPDFVIIARTDEIYRGGTIEEVIRRGKAYAEAGADVFAPHSTPVSDIDRIAKAVLVPYMGSHHRTSEVKGTKLKISNHGGPPVREAAFLHQQMLRHLKKDGEWGDVSDWYDESMRLNPAGPRAESLRADFSTHITRDDFRKLTDDDDYLEVARGWLRAKGIERPSPG